MPEVLGRHVHSTGWVLNCTAILGPAMPAKAVARRVVPTAHHGQIDRTYHMWQ